MSSLTPTELRALRENLELTQNELASQLGRSRRTILRWENGETTPSTATTLHLRQLVRESAQPMTLPHP